MRREMIKKKEKEAAEAKVNETEAVSSSTTIPVLKKAPVPVLPIFFHFIAVLLLFLAGIDIGWNQVVFSDVIVYRELTPMVEGVGLVNRYMIPHFPKRNLLDPSKLAETQEYVAEEEFVSAEEQEEEYIPNIDPIFQGRFRQAYGRRRHFEYVGKGRHQLSSLTLASLLLSANFHLADSNGYSSTALDNTADSMHH